jgi:tetratricopeptide (TPR) repeat protein
MTRNAARSFASLALCAATALTLAGPAAAQRGLTLPPSGDNQRSTVSQNVGLVHLTVDYSSPDVHAPNGDDRHGKIWGQLVPFGMANLGFGTCGDQCPWRGGANENTVFTTSHDIKVEGQPLPAGSYGLSFIAGPDQWTAIFSKNHTSWGSYFYDAKEDALRVQVKREKSDYNEWLTYEFTDRHPDKATVALKWEDLQVPIHLTVDNANDLYVENLRRELRSDPGFNWQNWNQAAQFALQRKVNLQEAEVWAQQAISGNFGGQENFTTLTTLAQLQEANGKTAEAAKTMDRALNHSSAGPIEIHQYGRQLQAQKKNEEAMKVFELNAKRNPGVWPVEVGLARGYSALGKKKEALEHAKKALAQAPDDGNRQVLQNMIKQLEEGK